jgi:hypothetical protein
MKTYVILVFFSVWMNLSIGKAQENPDFKSNITEENLKKHIEYLSAKDLGGRLFATPGEKNAANYIREQFRKCELVGNTAGVDSFFQNYSVCFDTLIYFYMENKNRRLVGLSDFFGWEWCFLPDSQNVNIVYAGFGLDRPDYSDYRNIDVKDKWVVVELNSPVDSNGHLMNNYDFDQPADFGEIEGKKETAKKNGALGVLFRMNSKQFQRDAPNNRSSYFNFYRGKDIGYFNRLHGNYPAMTVNQPALDSLMGISTERLNMTVISRLKQHNSASGIANCTAIFKIGRDYRFALSQNVIGIIKGKNQNKTLVISAHYDDVARSEDVFYPGANDNASGTAALIELANSFSKAAKSGFVPDQTIVFAAFSGEEGVLLGSEYYSKNQKLSSNNNTFNINLDCIGMIDSANRGKGKFTYVFGPDSTIKRFKPLLLSVAQSKSDSINLDFNQNPYGWGLPMYNFVDNASFTYNNVSALGFLSGLDYWHTPEDSPEKLNYSNVKGVTQFVFETIWRIAYYQPD